MGKARTYAEIKEFVESNSDCELLSDQYKGTFEPLRLRCKCGEEFSASWHQFCSQNRRSCLKCALEARASKRRKTTDEIKRELNAVGLEYVSGEYKNHKSKITIKCRCGHEKTMIYCNIFYNGFSGLCDECAWPLNHGSNRLTIDEVREMAAARGLELLSTEYTKAKDKLRFRCECGEEFETAWATVSYNNKVRCDKCSQRMSSGERAIAQWLDDNEIVYEREKEFKGLMGPTGRSYRFDFYIPSKNLCIEFDGQQHSKVVDYSGKGNLEKLTAVLWETQMRDWQKTYYCEHAGIDLLRVDFTQLECLSELLADKLIPR